MDVSPPFSFASAPLSPHGGSILRPIVLENGPQVQAFLSLEPPALEGAALAPVTPGSMVLAQQFDQDILGDMGSLWNIFIESGQVWALIIGVVIGYLVRGLTAY